MNEPTEKPRTYLPRSEAVRIARQHAKKGRVPAVVSFLDHCFDNPADVELTLAGLRKNTDFLTRFPREPQR